jgi:acyl carrier protein
MSAADPAIPAPPPTQDDLRRDLRQLILRVCPQLAEDALADECQFASLGVSSMDVICIVFEIEETYCLDITGPGLDDFETLGEMLNVVHRLLLQRERGA